MAGGSGLIGSSLIPRLLHEGAIVRATLHKRPPVFTGERVEYVKADLTKGEDCRRVLEGMELVYLCAASSSGALVVATSPMVHVTPNVLINTQVLEAAHAAGVQKLLWLSSTTVYPPSGNRPVREDSPLMEDPYPGTYFSGMAKRFGEVLCRMYGEKIATRMTTIILRPTNVYGPNDDFEPATSHVIPALIRKVVERQNPVEVWGTGEEVRDAIYVDDMVEAMIVAMERVACFDILNVGRGQGASIREILTAILEVDGFTQARVIFDPSKPTTFPIRLVDTTKAETVLGFKAKTDLWEGLRRTIKWYRESRNIARTAERI